ncbi:type II toxin-antitoxin system PemK/MazF family toxin [Planctomicrobium piriforme]|uniref:type II toxin-antitoxin system PemK/MazF family toxin n=1 Tax=Planctomicrobium piriforme TaxID=1576369 RepID=UPI0036F2C142
MHRGEIWWADLGEPRGSEPGFRRPVLIIQSDIFNSSRINTVLAAIITSNQQRAAAPGNVLLSRKASGLPQVSVVNVSQLVTVDKAFLSIRIRKLNSELMTEVDAGLSLVLGLP